MGASVPAWVSAVLFMGRWWWWWGGVPLNSERCSHIKHGVYTSSIPVPSAPLGGALLTFAGLVRCFLHQEVLPDAPWENVVLSSGLGSNLSTGDGRTNWNPGFTAWSLATCQVVLFLPL